MPEDTYGTGGGMQVGNSGFFGDQGGVVNAPNPNVGSGDIVLNNGGVKKDRKWLVVAGLILLVLLIGAFVVAKLGILKPRNDSGRFEALMDYVEDGTGFKEEEAGEETSNDGLIYAIRISSESVDEIAEYYAGLEKKEEEFFAGSKDDELLNNYKFGLQVLKNAINYQAVEDELIRVYSNEGIEGVQKYFEENLGCSEGESVLNTICLSEQNYYDAVAKEYALYTDIGCNKNGYYDALCAIDYYGEENFFNKLDSLESATYYLEKFSNSTVKTVLNQEITDLGNSILRRFGNA